MRKIAILLFILFSISTLSWAGLRIINKIEFNNNCVGYLKRAADANTIELAIEELSTALLYIEENGLTTGYVSIFLKQPKNDIGFWYRNLSSSKQELLDVKPDAEQLEKTNVLMKLRETLVDSGEDTKVTFPDGISIYPQNVMFFWWGMFNLLGLGVSWLFIYLSTNTTYGYRKKRF